MSVYEYTSPPTVTVDGVRVPIEGVTFDALRAADSHAEAVSTTLARRGFAAGPQRVEFTVADSDDAFAAITAVIDAANRETARAILGGVVPALSVSGRLYPDGSRGCFHEGCDGTRETEEGGTHWCTMDDGR